MKIDISIWVKQARTNAQLTQQQLADKLNLTKAAVSAYETGRNEPNYETIIKIAQVCNTRPPIDSVTILTIAEQVKSNATIAGGVSVWDNNTPLNDDEVEVPFYKEVCLSAGNGFADDIADHNNKKLRFSKATFKRYNIQPEEVVCVTADGDSMEPVFPDGATLGINTARKTIKDGKIFAFNHGGLLRVKVLQRLPDNKVRIKSYNIAEYPDEEVLMEDINILGHVFWWSVIDV